MIGVSFSTTTDIRKSLEDGRFGGFIKSTWYDMTYIVPVTGERTYHDAIGDTEFEWLIKDKEYGVNYLAISQYAKERIAKLNTLIVSRKMMYCELALEENLHNQGNTRSGPITYVYDHKRKGSGEYIELERELRDRSEDIVDIVWRSTELEHKLRNCSARERTGFESTLRECSVADDKSIFKSVKEKMTTETVQLYEQVRRDDDEEEPSYVFYHHARVRIEGVLEFLVKTAMCTSTRRRGVLGFRLYRLALVSKLVISY